MRRLLLDATVPIYAAGRPHAMREPCTAWMEAVAQGLIKGYASTEMVQEFVFHRIRVTGDRWKSTTEAQDLSMSVILLPFDTEVLNRALALLPTVAIGGRDCVHAATALSYGIDAIVTSDKAFDTVPGLRRIDPTVQP